MLSLTSAVTGSLFQESVYCFLDYPTCKDFLKYSQKDSVRYTALCYVLDRTLFLRTVYYHKRTAERKGNMLDEMVIVRHIERQCTKDGTKRIFLYLFTCFASLPVSSFFSFINMFQLRASTCLYCVFPHFLPCFVRCFSLCLSKVDRDLRRASFL